MNIKMITSAPAPSSLTLAHTAAWQEQTVNMTQVKGRDKQIIPIMFLRTSLM